jgi:MSHA biogenesis protein MshK
MILGLFSSASVWALNDPTRPTDPSQFFGSTSTANSADLMLQSVLFAPERRVAVINGTRLQEGDRIGSARVVRIQDSQVLLETSRGMRTLRLLPQTLKR